MKMGSLCNLPRDLSRLLTLAVLALVSLCDHQIHSMPKPALPCWAGVIQERGERQGMNHNCVPFLVGLGSPKQLRIKRQAGERTCGVRLPVAGLPCLFWECSQANSSQASLLPG